MAVPGLIPTSLNLNQGGQSTPPQNLPTSNMNPGDLRFAGQQGAQANSTGFAKFSDPTAGFGALLNDIQTKMNNHPDWTLADFSNVYAPASDGNNPGQYATNLANQMGVSPDTPISQLEPKIGDFANAIAHNEGYDFAANSNASAGSNASGSAGLGAFYTPPSAPENPIAPTTPIVPNQQPGSSTANIGQGFISSVQQGNAKGAASAALRDLLPILPDLWNDLSGQNKRSFLQQAADLGLTALDVSTVIPGIGEITGLGRLAEGGGLLAKIMANPVARTALMGAGYGAAGGGLQALAQGGGARKVLQGAGVGTLTGGALGGALGGASQLLDYLPSRIAASALKIDPATGEYALKTQGGIHTIPTMLKNSWQNRQTYEDTIQNILAGKGEPLLGIEPNASYATTLGAGNQSLQNALSAFPQSKILNDAADPLAATAKAIGKVVPGQGSLIDKVMNGEATLAEKNALRKAIDPLVHPKYTDTSRMTFNKQVAKSFADNLRQEVQTVAPETKALFKGYAKEITLNKALNRIAKRSPGGPVGLRDLVGALAGGAFGLPSALGGALFSHLTGSPEGLFTVAKGIRGLVSPALRGATAPALAAAARGVPQLTQ
ncbi:MAG: hypothetical protein KGJ90_04085 [Patescibacteria group bacterium]|nr:hypothetical protein [Patescibacteria group bacterium]